MSYKPTINGFTSILNTTTTPLSAGLQWTGDTETIEEYASISVTCTVEPITANGTLHMEFSPDGVEWTFGKGKRGISIPITSENASNTIHNLIPILKHFRVRYENGVSGQTTLNIQTMYSPSGRIALPTSRLSQTLTQYNDVLNTRGAIVGVTPDGDYQNVGVDTDGSFVISSEQVSDAGNTAFITTGSTTGHETASPYVGTPFATRSRNIHENLIVFAAKSGNTFLSDLSGTINFNYYPDDGNGSPAAATIVENLPVRSFGDVRNIGWLSNAGDYFSVGFTPDRSLVGDEFVSITTTHSKLTGNDFKRLPGQTLEEENQTLPVTTSFLKGFNLSGDSKNLRVIKPNDLISNNEDVLLTKSVLTGSLPSGNYKNIDSSSVGGLNVSIVGPIGAFGEVTMSEMTPVIQGSFPYNINSRLVITATSGGTVTQSDNMAILSSSTVTNSSALLESIQRVKYRGGQGVMSRFTGIFTPGATTMDSAQWLGLGNATDGYFFGYSGSSFGISHRINGNIDFIPQTSWNVDKMDGSNSVDNPTSVNLMPQYGNVYQIQFAWLGFGVINFYIESGVDGLFHICHQIKYTNQNTVPHSYNPTFPMCLEVNNGTSTDDLVLKTASYSAFIEGPNTITGPQFAHGVSTAAAVDKNMLTIKSGEFFPSGTTQENKVTSYLRNLSMANDGGQNSLVTIQVVENGTISAPSYVAHELNTSTMLTDVTGAYTTGTGTVLASFSLAEVSATLHKFETEEIAIRPGNTISFITQGDSSTTTKIDISWVEDF